MMAFDRWGSIAEAAPSMISSYNVSQHFRQVHMDGPLPEHTKTAKSVKRPKQRAGESGMLKGRRIRAVEEDYLRPLSTYESPY